MSSGFMPKWKRFFTNTPLMVRCPEGNYHWIWDRLCICCDYNERPIYYRAEKSIWIKIGEKPEVYRFINKKIK